MIKALLWDMDGTLVDSEHIAVAALQKAMVEAGLKVPENLMEIVMGRAADDLYRTFQSELGLRMDPIEWERRKHHHYFEGIAALQSFASALAVWRAAEARGLAQAIVSNSDRAIVDANLRAVGLARPGLVTISRNDVRHGKPAPEGYLRAAWLLGVEPAETIVIEDSASGAAAGIAARMKTAFVPHAIGKPPTGTYQLSVMSDLLSFLS